MRRILATSFFFILLNSTKSQIIPKNVEDLKPLKVKIDEIEYEKKLPFRNIEVLDLRFDTSKVGFCRTGGGYKKIYVENGLQYALNVALNTSLKKKFR